jgi:m7GpppX diphosphatase
LDWKYSADDLENLYLIGLAKRRDIKSIRDLTDEHLPILKSFRDNGYRLAEERFGMKKS